MAVKTSIGFQEFLQLPSETADGLHYELDEGELVSLSPSVRTHGVIVSRISAYLLSVLDPARFTVASGELG
jgi:Uma2 family endonuclease